MKNISALFLIVGILAIFFKITSPVFFASVIILLLTEVFFCLSMAHNKEHEEEQRELEKNEAEVLAFEKQVGAR